MSEVLEFAARLSTVVGARPAGTEEEQQASFFIEEVMTETGLDTSVEEFNCNPNYEMPRIACCIASIVLAVLAIILPLMVLPAFIVCAIAAVFYILEVMGASPLTNATKGGVSQNVIAKYYPGMNAGVSGEDGLDAETDGELERIDGKNASGGRRRKGGHADSRSHRKRKIVILARYDSGRVRAELKPPIMGILDKIHWVEMGGMVLVPVALLLRFLTGAVEDMHLAWDIVVGVGAVCAILPVIAYIMHQTAAYSEGANNNASGVAVMTEVAKRLVESSKPSLSSKVIPDADGLSFSLPAEVEDDPTVIAAIPEPAPSSPLPMFHGKEAIINSGVLPVDTDLIYDEAANGTLEKGHPYIEYPQEEEVVEASADATVAFMPVATERPEEEGSSSQPLHNGRQSALSLEAQMQSASLEFAKYDEQQEEDEKNPWIRLQNQAAEKERAEIEVEEVRASTPPDVTADLLGAQTIAIQGETKVQDDPNVPDWFKKGMAAASANKPEEDAAKSNIQRSRFADALDAAHETSAQAIANFEGKNAAEGDSGIDRARLDELHAKIMGESPDSIARGKGTDTSAEAKAARRAKLLAARDAKNASKGDGDEAIAHEKLLAEELEDETATVAEIEAKIAAQAAAQVQAAEEVAEQAAVADRTISFIPVAADIPPEVSAKSAAKTGSHEPIKKTAEEILDDAASITGSHRPVSADESAEGTGRRSISLPSLTPNKKKASMQDAPLAEDAARAKGEDRTALKSVGGETEYGSPSSKASKQSVKEGVSQSLEGATTSFLQETEADALAALSSLDAPKKKGVSQGSKKATSGPSRKSTKPLIPTADVKSIELPDATDAPISVSTAGSFVQPSQTSNFKPVGDELIANMNEEDIIVEDVDDSDYTENITHTGAIAGPGYVEMPKSRMHRIRSFFGKKKTRDEEVSISFSDAVGLDEDFDAREVGKARGGWESFKDDSANFDNAGTNAGAQPQGAPMGQPNSGQLPNQMAAGAQMPMQGPRPGMQPMPGHPQNASGNLQQNGPQNMQAGPGQMPMQGPRPGQMPMGMPMQGQYPMGQPPMPMQGRMPQQMTPQGQMSPQYQGQMRYPMQGQPMGQPNSGQLPNQMAAGAQAQGQPLQGGPLPTQGGPSTPLRGEPIGQPAVEKVEVAEAEVAVDVSEKAAKKSHSFNFFKRKEKDGDMNSGAFDDADWNGGAFSLGRDKDQAEGSSRHGRRSEQDSSRPSRRSSRNQSASGGRRRSADEVLAEEAMAELAEDELMAQDMLDERDQIRNFRSSSTQMTSFEEVAAFASSFSKHAAEAGYGDAEIIEVEEEPDIGFQTEVWFVALGAELANNAGIKNLLAEHADELRGAVIIDIDAFGAGELSVIEEEGVIKRVKSSSRMRRYASKAAGALGIKLGKGKMLWRESAAYYTTKRGLLTMHLCGMLDGKPAYAGEADDTFDKLSEEKLLENTAFMLELVNAI